MFRHIILCAFFVLASIFSFAQEVIRQQPCNDAFIASQADSLKKLFTANGYHVLREASMQMESEYEMPVIVPMDEKVPYRFVFIGDATSRLWEVRMYDWEEKEVVYLKNKQGDGEGANMIIFDYVPKFSEMHMIKPVQVNKKKKTGLCGYVLLFRKNPLVRK